MLSKPGANVTIPRPTTASAARDLNLPAARAPGPERPAGGSQDLAFPWQRGSESDDQSPESSLIGKVRIVPVVRQNALAILAPQAYIEPMAALIHSFDMPRRQVQLSATIVEVDITDQLNFGFKYGTEAQPSSSVGGQFFGGGIGGAATAGKPEHRPSRPRSRTSCSHGDHLNLNINTFDVRVIIEALAQVTNTRIIHEPRVFTADNEEAVFFSGMKFPFRSATRPICPVATR